jgi:CPA2 family monovalent cation:H+ antiporter-2
MADAHHILDVIAPIILLLGLGVAAAVASRELGLSPIVGYLLLGLGLGATGVVADGSREAVAVLAELGVVFLLFDIGLHFSFKHLRQQAGDIFGFGPVQVLFGTLGLGGLALAAGYPPFTAMLVGATLALSSTAVVARLIAERHQQNCPVGLTATAILVFQDVAAIFILIVATTLGTGEALMPATGAALGKAAAAFAVAVLLARFLVRPAFDLVARSGNEEVFTASALLVALAAGWATGAIGLSLTLGAFLGGMMLSDTPYRPIIQSEVKPFRGLLLGFFFISVGLAIDVRVLVGDWWRILLVAGGLMAAKAVLNALAAGVFRWSVPGSTQLGFLLAQGSEFAFVIFSLPAMRALLGEREAAVLIAGVAVTLALTPNVAQGGRSLAGRMRRAKPKDDDPELIPRDLAAPVFIAGMGARGRAVADALTEFDIAYVAIERDAQALRIATADGYHVLFGDIGDPRIWDPVAMDGRRVSVLTAPDLETSRRMTPIARRYFPDLKRFAVVRSLAEAASFAEAGLTPVVDDADAPGVEAATRVLAEMDVEPAAIDAWVRRRRERMAGAGEALVTG